MSQSLGMAIVSHSPWAWSGPRPTSWPWPPHRSSLQLSSLLLPAKEPAGHAPDRGLFRFVCGSSLLLAAAPSVLEDEEPAPAWGPLDQTTPPGPLQSLHHSHGGQYPYGG